MFPDEPNGGLLGCRILPTPRMHPPNSAKPRLAYIDWMRGLACVLMFQTHCYDSWLGGSARKGDFYMYSQLGGTFPAPLFLFLAGISFALVTEKLLRKGLTAAQIARQTIRRGAEVFAFGLLFRLQEYVIAWGWAPKTDLLRVDVLNTIGLSMMLMGVLCWLLLAFRAGAPAEIPADKSSGTRASLVLAATGTTLLISLFAPLVWTTWRPVWLPWPLESYFRWSALSRLSASRPISRLSMDGLRFRGSRLRVHPAERLGAHA